MPSYQACRGRCEVIDAGGYSLPYVTRWVDGDITLIEETAQRVIAAARTIMNAVAAEAAA